jgi:hypothetical protein
MCKETSVSNHERQERGYALHKRSLTPKSVVITV